MIREGRIKSYRRSRSKILENIMSYAFRTTYRQNAETYVEDRGYAHTVTKGQASFATLDAEFGKILAVGQTARRNSEGDGWEVVDGFPLLDSVKAVKLAEINRAYESTLAALTPTYPNSERLTFNKQEEEARAWDKDNTAPTPLLDALAAGRQMDKAELVRRVLVKADAFTVASGLLTGQRQRMEDALEAAASVEEAQAIPVAYSLDPVAGIV